MGVASKVFLNPDGIVEQIFVGDLTAPIIKKTIMETNQITAKIRRKKPVLILTDLAKAEKADYGAKKASLEGLTSPQNNYDRVAIFGASPFMRVMSDSIIKAAGAGERVKNFSDREKALGWLKEG